MLGTCEQTIARRAGNPSTLHGVHHIERGYHRPYEQFASLGLRLTRDHGGADTEA